MSYIVFENNGEIDIRSIKTFGISVKENANPIGFFGTGLKYAIAIALRNGLEVTALVGNETYKFGLESVSVRGKGFDVITMNGIELPFTTELGKNWELWQAFREIYCNCLDEAGTVSEEIYMPENTPGKTIFIIQGEEFTKLYHDKGSIVLDLDKNLLASSTGKVDAYNVPSSHFYYRGIRVFTPDQPTRLLYNVTEQITLTEDRTAKHEWDLTGKVSLAVAMLRDMPLIKEMLTLDDRTFESSTAYDSLNYNKNLISEEFKIVLSHEYNMNNDRLNPGARDFWKKLMQKDSFKQIDIVDTSEVEAKQLKKCIKLCKILFTDFGDYEIIVVKNLGESTMAFACRSTQRIILSKRCFELGTKFLMSTMIEEYAHLKTGYGDETRELQTWLFDTICTVAENHIFKEPI